MNLSDINLVVSSDNSWYLDYARLVRESYSKFFPEFKVHLAIVTENVNALPLAKYEEIFNSVRIYPDISGIPSGNQGKISRLIRASEFGDSICMIEDIDTIPLQRAFIEQLVEKFKHDELNAVGHEVYTGSETGKFPMSNVTASGKIFKEIFNPLSLEWKPLIKSYNVSKFDDKEKAQNAPGAFSDESLFRRLIAINYKGKINKVQRGVNIVTHWINREKFHNFTTFKSFDRERLKNSDYILANLTPKPRERFNEMKEVFDYIYNKDTTELDLFL